jgi:uncharacterized protein YecE (DUF72 family)
VIRTGPAGWSYADWEGRAWPRSKPRGFHPLRHLARFVDCVELNTTFYALPDPAHCARWVELVADRPQFRFTAKLHRDLTHGEETSSLSRMADDYKRAVEPLSSSGRLAALLAQFPQGFRCGEGALERLELLAQLFSPIPLALELRHGSWFVAEALGAIERQGWSLASIDLPAVPHGSRVWQAPADVPHIGPLGYLRLHGRNSAAWFDSRAERDDKYDYLYGEQELEELVQRARRIATGRDETYVVTNNHFGAKAFANALELRARLAGERVRAPAELIAAFPRLNDIAQPAGQQELFG